MFLSKLFRKQEKSNGCDPIGSFNQIMKLTKIYLSKKEIKEQLIVLDYLIDSLKIDLCSTEIITPLKMGYSDPNELLFPQVVYDENGNQLRLSSGKRKVELAKVDIYVRPWCNERTIDNIIYLFDKKFEYDEMNHDAIYYDEIQMCCVLNGNHSINAGRYLKKGEIKAEYHDMRLLFEHCYCDCKHWYSIHTGQPIHEVSDFRAAAIYELARKRYEIKKCYDSIK